MILFSADWHIKLGQKNVPVDWARRRYEKFFKEVHSLEDSVDLHIIGGDLFDRMPTLDELALYFAFIKNVSTKTIIFDGNHEATKKGKTFLSTLKEVTHNINPKVSIIDESCFLPDIGASLLPYVDLHKKDSIEALIKGRPVFTHVRGEIPPHVKPEVDLERFDKFPIVFAGDLHSHSNSQRNIVYPGSPMTTSFHRELVKTGYILIDENLESWEWKEFDLPQLIRRTVQNQNEMIPTEYHHTIYELEGDLEGLAHVNNSDLLDKKVVKRNSEASLIISKDMSVEEELSDYLRYILEIDEDKISKILGLFNDYSAEINLE